MSQWFRVPATPPPKIAPDNVFDYGFSFLDSISELRKTEPTGRSSVTVMGLNAKGDSEYSDWYYDSSDTAALDNGVTVVVTARGRRWKRQTAVQLSVSFFGADPNGIRDSRAAIQAALDFSAASNNRQRLIIPPGTYKLSSGLNIDISKIGFDAKGVTFDFSSMVAGNAFNLFGSVAPPYFQGQFGFDNCELIGNSKNGVVTGISMVGAVNQGPSHVRLSGISIHDFGTGVYFGQSAYCNNLISCDIFSCGIAIDVPNGLTDGGERNTFVGCTIFNNNLAVRSAYSPSSLHFSVCSLDYNIKQCELTNGSRVIFSNCHIEGGDYPATPFTLDGDGTHITFIGGWHQNTKVGARTYAVFFAINHLNAGVTIRDMQLNNLDSNTGFIASGIGSVNLFISGIKSFNTTLNAKLTALNTNIMLDSGFESVLITDDIAITGDTSAITSRFTGANIVLSNSNLQARNGLQSLKASKTFGGGSQSSFAFFVPVTHGARTGWSVWYRKPGAQAGTMFVEQRWATVRVSGDGVPTVVAAQATSSLPVVFVAAATPWTEVRVGEPQPIAPPWATHMLISINLDGVGAGDVFFDDVIINRY